MTQQRATRPALVRLAVRRALDVAPALALVTALVGCTAPAGSAASAGSPSSPVSSPTSTSTRTSTATPSAAPPPAATGPAGIPPATAAGGQTTVAGVDVSPYQPTVAWAGLRAAGVRFAYVKASEGTGYTSPRYAAQRDGARAVGILVGGYHYARPASSSGAAQARALLAVTGGWSPDGQTLPGALDLEDSTTGPACHGRSPAQLLAWVREFADTYRQTTGRAPVLYVKAEVWDRCLAADRSLGTVLPLWLYDHEPPMGPLPTGWVRPTLWQRGVEGGIDRDVFLGTQEELLAFARSG